MLRVCWFVRSRRMTLLPTFISGSLTSKSCQIYSGRGSTNSYQVLEVQTSLFLRMETIPLPTKQCFSWFCSESLALVEYMRISRRTLATAVRKFRRQSWLWFMLFTLCHSNTWILQFFSIEMAYYAERTFAKCVCGGVLTLRGFIDGTLRKMCQLSFFQKLLYSGYKRAHGIKFQSVVAPDALNLYVCSNNGELPWFVHVGHEWFDAKASRNYAAPTASWSQWS